MNPAYLVHELLFVVAKVAGREANTHARHDRALVRAREHSDAKLGVLNGVVRKIAAHVSIALALVRVHDGDATALMHAKAKVLGLIRARIAT